MEQVGAQRAPGDDDPGELGDLSPELRKKVKAVIENWMAQTDEMTKFKLRFRECDFCPICGSKRESEDEGHGEDDRMEKAPTSKRRRRHGTRLAKHNRRMPSDEQHAPTQDDDEWMKGLYPNDDRTSKASDRHHTPKRDMHYDRVGTLGRMRYKVPRSHRSKKELVKMFRSKLSRRRTRRKMMASGARQNMPSMEDNCMENFDMATL